MKRFIVFGFLFCGAMAFTEKQQEVLNYLRTKCISQTGVSEDIIDKVKSGDFIPDPKLKCYMRCYFAENGVLTSDGNVDVEGAIATLPDEMKDFATSVFTKCGSQAGTNSCDVVFNTMKCYYDMDKRAFVLP
ncbi:unnamed protein product [Diabrotica balteata]|uniref:Uncharacterized protein n=1 Tax=Diabrotica balteata TaxID=107213 RepID=A0A9P0DV60_DIABA|nr:unnamed protein product [Diabrotica balteata]